MLTLLLAIMLTSSRSEIPPDIWRCDNQIEVWCTVDSCAAKRADETTPLDIWVRESGAFAVCAYTGCWEGDAQVTRAGGRLLWTADNVPFYSGKGGFMTDITLMIIEKDGVGFIRAGGIATPVLCLKAPPVE